MISLFKKKSPGFSGTLSLEDYLLRAARAVFRTTVFAALLAAYTAFVSCFTALVCLAVTGICSGTYKHKHCSKAENCLFHGCVFLVFRNRLICPLRGRCTQTDLGGCQFRERYAECALSFS